MKDYQPEQNKEYPIPADLDLEILWNDIEDKRNKKKRRRRLAILLPALLGFLVLLFWLIKPTPTIKNNIGQKSDTVLEYESNKTNNIIMDHPEIAQVLEKKLETQSEKTVDLNTNADLNQSINNNARSISDTSISDNHSLDLIKDKKQANDDRHLKSTLAINTIRHKHIEQEIIKKSRNNVFIGNELAEQTYEPGIHSLSIPLSLLPSLKRELTKMQSPTKLSFPIVPITNDPKLLIGARMSLGVSHRNFTLKNTLSLNDQNYYDHRFSAEKVLESYAGEGYLKGNITPSFFYETGLRLSSVTLKSNSQYQVNSRVFVQSDSAIIIEQLDGSLTYQEGLATTYNSETYLSNKYNNLWSVGIPFRLGYQRSLNKVWTIGLATGIIYNLSSWGNGLIIAPQNIQKNFTYATEAGYDIQNLFQSSSKLSLFYRWKYNWVITGGLGYTQDLNSRLNHIVMNDKYKTLNAEIGIAFKIK